MTSLPPTLPTLRGRFLATLERLSLRIESRLQARIRNPLLNPLYQSGPLTVFLLILVGFSGVYITLFYQYGFALSYNAVARMNRLGMSHIMRAVHRWGAQATMLWGLIHAYRTFFMGRFRGPRWLAWVTGVVMVLLLVVAGLTGYMMVFDQRAQALTTHLLYLLQSFTPWGDRFALFLITAEAAHRSWLYPFLLLVTHILAFLLLAGSVWLHIRRLSRPRWFPESPWVFVVALSLLTVAILLPAEIGLPFDLTRLVRLPVRVDPIYLPFLVVTPRFMVWLLLGLTAIAAVLPWLPLAPDHPRLEIHAERCIGCTLCAHDCPYGAITMAERHDGSHHKWIAVAHPERCVGCGICLGSCNDHGAISIGGLDYQVTLQAVDDLLARREDHPVVAFTCERHLAVSSEATTAAGDRVLVPLPCVGALPPQTIAHALDAGAREVQVIGCPPGDCANREGNLWTAARLARERQPHLRLRPLEEAVHAVWTVPTRLKEALTDVFSYRRANEAVQPFRLPATEEWLTRWRELVPTFLLLVLSVLVPSVGMYAWRAVPVLPATSATPQVQFFMQAPQPPGDTGAWAVSVDGRVVVRVPVDRSPLWLTVSLKPGEPHTVRFIWQNTDPVVEVALWEQTVTLAADEVLMVNPGWEYPH